MGLLLKSIEVRNFGPYMGTTSLQFGEHRPLTLVHGDNELGKTFMLNALRWALYAHALDRFSNIMPIVDLVNKPARNDGDWTMSVKLHFEVDGVSWSVERRVQAKKGLRTPRNNGDFDEKLFCEQGGRLLDPIPAQAEINRILPEQTSRFFLFDGELLTKYELLLSDTTGQARLIKESIEDILGVPALLHAMADLKINRKEATTRQQLLVREDSKATVLSTQLDQVEAAIGVLEDDLGKLQDQINERVQAQQRLDDDLRAVASYETDVARLLEVRAKIEALQVEEGQRLQERRDKLKDAWRDIVRPTVQRRLDAVEVEKDNLTQSLVEAGRLRERLATLDKLINDGKCPVCGQIPAPEAEEDWASERTALMDAISGQTIDDDRLVQLTASAQRLRQIRSSGVLDTIRYLDERLKEISVALADEEIKRDEIDYRLRDVNTAAVARYRRDYDRVTEDIGALKLQITAKEQEISEKQIEAQGIRERASKLATGKGLQRLNREVQIYDELYQLFERGVERLRDDLRREVEREASQVFLQLTHNPHYVGLRINDNYGLRIIGDDGDEVDVRSAGAEQIVALALLTALNRNAIRNGPVVMDTPLGRLDRKHRANILKFLPEMADQVTMLVHDGELSREVDLPPIKDKIDREYEVRRLGLMRSEIALLEGE